MLVVPRAAAPADLVLLVAGTVDPTLLDLLAPGYNEPELRAVLGVGGEGRTQACLDARLAGAHVV